MTFRKITQRELVMLCIKKNKEFTPAYRANSTYKDGYSEIGWFGSEVSRVCRTLRKEGVLESHKNEEGYEVFTLTKSKGQTSML